MQIKIAQKLIQVKPLVLTFYVNTKHSQMYKCYFQHRYRENREQT